MRIMVIVLLLIVGCVTEPVPEYGTGYAVVEGLNASVGYERCGNSIRVHAFAGDASGDTVRLHFPGRVMSGRPVDSMVVALPSCKGWFYFEGGTYDR